MGAVAVGVSLFFSALAAILALMAYRSTKRAEVAQTRAYLFPETTFLADGSHHEIEGDYEMVPAAIITIKNYGSTPARDVRHWAAVVITPNVEDVTLPEPDMSKAAPTFCAPGAVLTFIRRVVSEARDQQSIYCFTDAMVGEIRAAQTAIVVYGRVAYTDIFGKKRTTNYRLGYSGKWPPPPNMSMTYSSYGNTDD